VLEYIAKENPITTDKDLIEKGHRRKNKPDPVRQEAS
jgi:hypothetical protein